jgi:hypothetical protein
MHCDEPLLERYERLEERELDLEDLCRRGCEELFVVFNSGKTCKSNSNNQRECTVIKYSIGIGSLVKPTGLTMYSPGCPQDMGSDNRQVQQADC